MKKFILLVGLLLCAAAAFCNEEAFENVDAYLDDNFSSVNLFFKNQETIVSQINLLTDEEKAELYEDYSRSGALYFGLNMLLAGLGSYIQGDTFGGTLGLVGGIVGGALFEIGTVSLILSTFYYATVSFFSALGNGSIDRSGAGGSSGNPVNSVDANYMKTALGLFISGAVICVIDIIYCIVRPFIYSNKLNSSLSNLLYNDKAKLTLAPVISTDAKVDGVYMGLALKF